MTQGSETEIRTRACQRRKEFLNRELDRFVETLIEDYSPERIIVFGSIASGTIREWSDIDMVIIKETDIPFLDRIEEVIHLVKPKAGFDILVYTPEEFEELGRTRMFFKEEVISKGKVIYTRET